MPKTGAPRCRRLENKRILSPVFHASATQWQKFERNIEKDFETYSGGPSWTNTDGLGIDTDNTISGDILYLDDLLLTNAMTIEHNTLGGGGIGQILRQRTIDTSTYAATDRWFHYDRVGSVVLETDSSGASAQSHDQDAFGNTLASWITGLIGGDRAGRHHNTKEFDSDIGLVYMYQRWYSPELGIFISSAPYPPMMEHRYSFAAQNPVSFIDPRGMIIEISGSSAQRDELRGLLKDIYNSNLYWRYILIFLDKSPFTVRIDYGNYDDETGARRDSDGANWIGNSPGPGSGTIITFNPLSNQLWRCHNSGAVDVLKHELAHAYLNAQGMRDRSPDLSSPANGRWVRNETQATQLQGAGSTNGNARPDYSFWPW